MGAMNKEDVKLYLQNIEEYVIDEDKIVTYKWLSKNLDVHVNTAKQLLHSFAVDQKDNVYLTYLVGGVKYDGSGCKIQIVPEEGLEEVKKSFKVVTSEHVYSVQKAKILPDLNLIYGVDSCKGNDSKRLGAVQYCRSVTRCQEEIEKLRLTALSVSSHADGKCLPVSKSTETTKSKPVETSASKKVVLPEDSKDGNGAVKNKGIAALFAAQGNKSKDNGTTEKRTTVVERSLPKQKTGGGITTFFNRQKEKQQLQIVKPENAKTNSRDKSEMKSCELKDGEKKDKSVKIISNVKVASNKESTCKKESITKSKMHEKNGRRLKNKKSNFEEEPVPSKKRKRIVVMSDSEDSSDDIFDKKDTDEESCLSNIEQPGSDSEAVVEHPDSESEAAVEQPGSESDVVPPTPEGNPKRGRKRVRRLVDKTYMDDGYLLTKKEYVFESCTDSEEEEKSKSGKSLPENTKDSKKQPEESKIIKANKNEPPAKKKASPQKTKQSTLMNFFKKTT